MVAVSVNGRLLSTDEQVGLDRILSNSAEQFLEVELSASGGGPILTALINGPVGWLMFLGEPGDAGFHSVNPDNLDDPDSKIEFVLANGQRDEYPASWALRRNMIAAVLDQFRLNPGKSDKVLWSEDG